MNSLTSGLLAASVFGAATCSNSLGRASAASYPNSLTITCAQVQDYVSKHGQTLLTTGKELGDYSFDYADCGGTVPGFACTRDEAYCYAVWLYVRFTLSYRDVEDLLAERGLDISYETVRQWVLKFGPLFARELRRRRPRPTSRWHLDEMAVTIASQQFWLWRAVDDEGEVLDLLVQRRRDKATAVTLMRKLLKKQRFAPAVLVPASFAPTARQNPKSDCRRAMSRGCAGTIGLRIRINRLDDASVIPFFLGGYRADPAQWRGRAFALTTRR